MNDLSLFTLDGSVALVTGASSGIGHEVAIGLAQAGAKVIAAARREDRLVSLVEKIDQQGGEALAVALDVAVLVLEGEAGALAAAVPVPGRRAQSHVLLQYRARQHLSLYH